MLELRNLLDSIEKEDRDAVLNMAASCFDAAESEEEAIERLGRPMAAARRVLKNYEPGYYAEMFEEEEVEKETACEKDDSGESEEAEREESIDKSPETPEEREKRRIDRIYAEVFAIEPDEARSEEAGAAAEPADEDGIGQEKTAEEEEYLKTMYPFLEGEYQEEQGEGDAELSEPVRSEDEGAGSPLEPESKEESRSEESFEIAKAVEERAASERRAEKEEKAETVEKPQYSVIKLIGYSIPAIALGVPVAIFLVSLSLVFVLAGVAIAAAGALIISFVFLNMAAISDILMTAGAGLAVFALGLEIFVLAIYFFGKNAVGFINRVFEGGARNCLKDKSKYRAPIVEEEQFGVRLVRTLSGILLSLLAIGILSFLFSMILGADIKRIAAAIFNKYDLAAVIRYLIDTFDGVKAFIFR